DLVVAAGDFLEHGFARFERLAALIDVADLHRLPDLEGAFVRLLLPGNHAEQRRLAGAVRTDHADDPAAREREVEVLDQEVVAVALFQPARFDHRIAEPRTGRDVDFGGLDFLRGVLLQELFVRLQERLPLRLSRPRRHADPFELAFERLLAPRLGLLFLREAVLLLFEPRRVVALPGDPVPAIELENPARDVVEEVAIVRDRHDGAGLFADVAL